MLSVTTCLLARICDWSLEAITIRELPAGNKSLATRAENSARPAKDSLDEEDHFLQESKKQRQVPQPHLQRRNWIVKSSTNGNLHDSARALAICLQTRDVTRKTEQSMTEAAKCMFLRLLGEASDDLERVTPQSRESLRIETTHSKHRCPRSETPSEKPCSRSETLFEKSCSRSETQSEKPAWKTPTDSTPMLVPIPPSPPDRSGVCAMKLELVSKTRPSRESLEQVLECDFRKQHEFSVPVHEPGEWKNECKMSSFTTTMLNLLFAEAERKGKTQNSWIGRFDCRQAVS